MDLQEQLANKKEDLKKISSQIIEINSVISKAQDDVRILTKNHDYVRGQADLIEELLKEEKE